jgi:putative transposase
MENAHRLAHAGRDISEGLPGLNGGKVTPSTRLSPGSMGCSGFYIAAAERRQQIAVGVSPQISNRRTASAAKRRQQPRPPMGSFTELTYHIVFATRYRRLTINDDIQERLYEYIGGTLRAKKGHLIEIGGTADHVHILARLSPSLAVADVIRDLKANSSKWMKDQIEVTSPLEWQKGYGAFTVSYSGIPSVQEYIQNQEEHHRTKTFQEEYIEFLKRHIIEFRLENLFEDEHHG